MKRIFTINKGVVNVTAGLVGGPNVTCNPAEATITTNGNTTTVNVTKDGAKVDVNVAGINNYKVGVQSGVLTASLPKDTTLKVDAKIAVGPLEYSGGNVMTPQNWFFNAFSVPNINSAVTLAGSGSDIAEFEVGAGVLKVDLL